MIMGGGGYPDISSRTEQVRRKDLRSFYRLMVFLAIATVVAGGALLPFHEAVRLDLGEARRIGTVFIAAGIADSLVLYFWERIFGGH